MDRAPQIGDIAPLLDLPTLQGGRIELSPRPPRPLILSFLRHAG